MPRREATDNYDAGLIDMDCGSPPLMAGTGGVAINIGLFMVGSKKLLRNLFGNDFNILILNIAQENVTHSHASSASMCQFYKCHKFVKAFRVAALRPNCTMFPTTASVWVCVCVILSTLYAEKIQKILSATHSWRI